MTIASSGALSFADLRTEYVGGSSAISFSDLYRGGSSIKTKEGDNPATNMAASVPASGTIDLADFYGTAKGFKATIDSSTTNVDVDTLFGGDYDTDYPKVVDIASGVTIGGSGDEAIDIPSGLASTLTINNAGTVVGFGGASAGAAGGHAINCATSGVNINNSGQISGGGGAGNVGGVGGGGSTTTTTISSRNTMPQSYLNHWMDSRGAWAGVGSWSHHPTATYKSYGGHTFYKGGYAGNTGGQDGLNFYTIIGHIVSTVSTSGGSGGSFGVGQGYNQSATNGTSGAAGGTNAGSGGAGSNGAALGTAAATSSAGANGTVSNGAAGNAGGAAGAAVTGTSVTMNNTGTIHGAVA